jgi:hypothetical protein
MTPTEQWILGLIAVYSVPSFFLGMAATLSFVRWRNAHRRGGTTDSLSRNSDLGISLAMHFAPEKGEQDDTLENAPHRLTSE